MCRSKNEGQKRCPDFRKLQALTGKDLAPAPAEGVPAVDWADSTDARALWRDNSQEIACETVKAIVRVRDIEPATTKDITGLAGAVGGRAAGLEYRMKSPESLARKITTKQTEEFDRGRSVSAEQVVSGLGDTLRYTVAVPEHDSIPEAGTRTVRELRARGWEITEVQSTYVSGNSYKGLHIIGKPPGGPATEVQVHSELSLAAKEDTHKDYEISRDRSQPLPERLAANARTKARSEAVPTPAGMDSLTEIDGIPIRIKTY